MPNTCGKCQATFDSRNSYSKHQKRCTIGITGGTTFTLPEIGREITVYLTDGLYICLCSATGCPNKKGFPSLEGLKKHLRKRKSWVTPSNVSIYVFPSPTFTYFVESFSGKSTYPGTTGVRYTDSESCNYFVCSLCPIVHKFYFRFLVFLGMVVLSIQSLSR